VVGRGTNNSKNSNYEILHRASALAGSCENGNERSGPIKGGEFIDQMSDHQLLKDSVELVSS
jgi:hypothetical protein